MHLKALLPGHWRTVRDTGVHTYEECSCGFRRVVRYEPSGFQPIDHGWLETGEWTVVPRRGPSVATGVRRVE